MAKSKARGAYSGCAYKKARKFNAIPILKVTNTCREVVVGVRTLSPLTDCNTNTLLKKVVTMRVIRAGKAVSGTQYELILKTINRKMGM